MRPESIQYLDRRAAQTLPFPDVGHQPGHLFLEGRDVVGRNQYPIDPRPDDGRGPAGAVKGQHWESRRHGFQQGIGETLVAGRQNEQIGRRQMPGGLGDVAQETHSRGDSEPFGLGLQGRAQRAISKQMQPPVREGC